MKLSELCDLRGLCGEIFLGPSVGIFECHVGNVIVTVWLKGDLVKIVE